jgi:hypothetical protein
MLTDGIPPPSRNHRTPTAAETPASAAASSLATPRAIAAQNRCRSFRRATDDRPGERIRGRQQSICVDSLHRAVPLDQHDATAVARKRQSCGKTRHPSAKDDHVRLVSRSCQAPPSSAAA